MAGGTGTVVGAAGMAGADGTWACALVAVAADTHNATTSQPIRRVTAAGILD
jgi:hypothetical protein